MTVHRNIVKCFYHKGSWGVFLLTSDTSVSDLKYKLISIICISCTQFKDNFYCVINFFTEILKNIIFMLQFVHD